MIAYLGPVLGRYIKQGQGEEEEDGVLRGEALYSGVCRVWRGECLISSRDCLLLGIRQWCLVLVVSSLARSWWGGGTDARRS